MKCFYSTYSEIEMEMVLYDFSFSFPLTFDVWLQDGAMKIYNLISNSG